MMRRYPVRSVLSERKMFSNGGMLPTSKPIESSMNQPSGILASSSPLIDAVSQEILAPMTGGAMPMAQGGVARFRNGGSSSELFRETRIKVDRLKKINALIKEGFPVDEAIRIVDGEGIPDVQVDSRAGPPRKDMNFLDPSPSANMFGSIYGQPDLPEGGPSFTNVNDGLLSLLPNANRPSYAEELASKERARNLNTPNLSESVIKTNPVDPRVAERIIGLGKTREIVQDPGLPESGETQPLESFALDKLVRQRMAELGTTNEIVQDPGLPESGGTPPSGLSEVDALTRQRMAELGTTMGIIQDPGLPESGATPPSTVAEAVIEAAPPPTDMSFLDPTSSVEVFDELYGKGKSPTETGEIFGDPSLTVDEQLELGEGPNAKAGFEIPQPMPSSISKPVFDPDREVSVDEELDALDSYFGSDNSQQIPTEELPEAQGDLAVEPAAAKNEDVAVSEAAAKNEEAVRKVENRLLSSASDEGRAGKAPGDDLTFDPEAPELSNRITPFDKTDMSEKEATKTIADFKKEFMDEMPEYEGMSEAEKGFALMEAGLRVAAGESPNAITNVAKGLKGLGAQFAKDEKEKRAFNRQIELSAVKYGLSSVQKNEGKLDALAKEGRVRTQFIVGKTFIDPSGVKREKGSLYRPTAVEQNTDVFSQKILPNLTTEGIYKERLDNAGGLAGIVRVGAKHGPAPDSITKALNDYTGYVDQSLNSAKMLTMIDSGIIKNAKGDITGFAPWASKKLNQLKNSVSYKKELKILDGINTKTGEGLEKFEYQQQVIANMMLKEILGEGSKNVSNIDRQLAGEIVGLLKGFNTVYADPNVLHSKLQGIRNVIEKSLDKNIDLMKNSETGYRNIYGAFAPGSVGRPVTADMASKRGKLFEDLGSYGRRAQKKFTETGRGPVVLKASDYFNFDNMTTKQKLPSAQ